jgi:hypothetical protein
MDFSFYVVRVFANKFSDCLAVAKATRFSFSARTSLRSASLAALSALGVISSTAACAAGDPNKGAAQWEYLCDHCHSTPQPKDQAAFRAYGKTANPLSLYASNPAAITKAINEGYIIPEGNTNDDYPPGTRTSAAMNSFVGMGEKRMGVGETPTQYAIDISAYLASYFDEPGVPEIVSVTAGNAQATVSFTAPKSDLPITAYTVTANPGGATATGRTSPIIVQGLSSGVAYTFTVKATSNAGTGKPSSASNAVTPVGAVPVAAIAAATLPVAPAAITAPVVVAKSAVVLPPAAPMVANQPPAFKQAAVVPAIVAVKPLGLTAANVATGPVANTQAKPVVLNNAPAGNAPAAVSIPTPTIIAAKPGSASSRVFFTIPQTAIPLMASYTAVAYTNGTATNIKATSTGSPITVTGLTNGTEYTFTVTANSKAGERATSAVSNIVTPLGIFGN